MKKTNINLQTLIELSQQGVIDPNLVDVVLDEDAIKDMLYNTHFGSARTVQKHVVVKSEEDELGQKAQVNGDRPFLTNWRNAEAVFGVHENTMRKNLVPGVTWRGQLPGSSKRMAMVEVDLSHPKLLGMDLTQEDFSKKRKKFYSTPELMKLWGFKTNQSVYSRIGAENRLMIGRLWKFPVAYVNDYNARDPHHNNSMRLGLKVV